MKTANELLKDIEKIKELEYNWDYQGSESPSHNSIDLCCDLLEYFNKKDMIPVSIKASKDHGVDINWIKDSRKSCIKLLNSGEALFFIENNSLFFREYWEVSMNDSMKIKSSLIKIEFFLKKI